jgi:HEAT repeat protein
VADQPSIKGLINRLKLPQPMARRIAISDLSKRAEPEAIEALIAHLPRETDLKAVLRIIDHLGQRRHESAIAVLISLRDNPETPVEVAHAATIACDRIEKRST